jgi:hypothetical protein
MRGSVGDRLAGERGPEVGEVAAPSLTSPGATGTSVSLRVCAGDTPGCPRGFTIRWAETSQTEAAATDEGCEAGFSGNANGSRFALGAGACAVVDLGDLADEPGASSDCGALKCGTEYAFEAFGHASADLKRSDWSAPLVASTPACTCTWSLGYWKNHPLAWEANYLKLGEIEYTAEQLGRILDEPVKGNGLIALAHGSSPPGLTRPRRRTPATRTAR